MNFRRPSTFRPWAKRTAVALAFAVTVFGLLRAVTRLLIPTDDVAATLADVVLDAGHGGADSGARGVGRTPLLEKEVTLDLARRTASLLVAAGYRVALTREEDETVSLGERLVRARRLGGPGAPIVSIHCNHAVERAAAGIETWHTSLAEGSPVASRARRWWAWVIGSDPGPGAAERAADSERLATCLQRAVTTHARRPDRGVRDGSLYLTRRASGPAVLVECGFVSNPAEAALLASEAHRQRLAEGLSKGIREFREPVIR